MQQPFVVKAPWPPAGDQPHAIDELAAALSAGEPCVTMLGITGSGKSATVAWAVEKLQRPTLVIAPNKSLAAQLASEFMALLPDNRVELFMSYYDYYQPEAYMPSADLFIEKESTVNAEIDRLRHSTTEALTTRRDTLVVASVSCIYALGPPSEYAAASLPVAVGDTLEPRQAAARLVAMGFDRTSAFLDRGRFRIQGDTIEVYPTGEESLVRIELFGDTVERIRRIDPLGGNVTDDIDSVQVFPATHWAMPADRLDAGCQRIEAELEARLEVLRADDKLLEARRLEERTRRDIELLSETGVCPGVENYSAQLEGRPSGEPPWTLLDYFDDDLLVVLDESHVGLPQIGGAYAGDHSRKTTLIEHGFRLPSSADNRPLTFDEFRSRVPQILCVSATPGPYETEHSKTTVELIVRPTGLLDPAIEVRPTEGQVDDLTERARAQVAAGNRILVTCLTKRNAEDLSEHLSSQGLKCRYLHSDVETLERIEILRDLRLGVFDVLVGINLLREGLDLPEVALVAVLDADKEGFLRSRTALIQTMGRAARNIDGHVVLYADRVTPAMGAAISETRRRRTVQEAYNTEHKITPATVTKDIADLLASTGVGDAIRKDRRGVKKDEDLSALTSLDAADRQRLRVELEAQMAVAADELRFEDAADLRDRIAVLVALG
jgi:excinuclease ABC subunit B